MSECASEEEDYAVVEGPDVVLFYLVGDDLRDSFLPALRCPATIPIAINTRYTSSKRLGVPKREIEFAL